MNQPINQDNMAEALLQGRVYKYMSNDYAKSFFKHLEQLRQDSAFCDVNLQVEDKKFPCHKVVLMSGSTYFHAMFVNEMVEHDKDAVIISGVNAVIFSKLLQFLYSGEIDVNEDNCEDLLLAADMFSIFEVVQGCCKFLKAKLQPDNCIGIYLFAEAVSCKTLRNDAEAYIHKNFLKVSQEEEFLKLPQDHLVGFLTSERLFVENEYQVFKAAMDWILYNPADRKKQIFDVMAPIRFPIISESQLDKYISTFGDADLSIKVVLQKIIADFRSERKILGLIDKKFKVPNVKSQLFVPRQCSRKNIYICGGFTRPKGGRWSDAQTLNTVERYDTFFKRWHECPSFQFHRSACGAGIINGQMCVVGGENDMLILDSVETYDSVTYEWKNLPGMTTPRCGLGVCSIDNCLYAIGGWVGSEIGGTVERYDPECKKWSVIAHCPSQKCWMGVTSDKGLIYIVGGGNDLGEELDSVECFNPDTRDWVTLPELNIRRSYPGVAVLDDCLYAVGGWNEQEGALKSLEKLQFEKGYWEEVSPMSTARAGASVVVVNSMIYVMGGRNYTDEFTAPCTIDTMEGYDPATDTWIDLGTMLKSRCEGAAVVI